MKKPTLTGEFSKYGAKPVNPRWACSAIAKDGSMVFSGWNHDLKPFRDGRLRYTGHLSGWGGNKHGNNLLRRHLQQAIDENLPVRLVVATAENPEAIRNCTDASVFRKTFAAREEVKGKVVMFNGDKFIIEFETT
jgi:putative restriction endonuclease